MMRPAALPAVRSVTAGRPAPGCSALKPRAIGLIFERQRTPACSSALRRSPTVRSIDAFGLFTGQIGWACEQRPALREGRRGRYRRSSYRGFVTTPVPGLASGTVFDRAERHPLGWRRRCWSRIRLRSELVGRRSSTITCSWGPQHHVDVDRRSFRSASFAHRPHPPGRRSRHRARQLSLGRPGHREVLIFAFSKRTTKRPASRRPFCLVVPRPTRHPQRLHHA